MLSRLNRDARQLQCHLLTTPGVVFPYQLIVKLGKKNLKNSKEFDAPCRMLPYLTPSIPTKRFSILLAVDRYRRASTQDSPTGENPKFMSCIRKLKSRFVK